MTYPLLDLDGIRDRVKQRIAQDPSKSIKRLAESLGVPQTATRQWKSEMVNNTFCHIEKSLAQLDQVATYLELRSEDLLVNNEISEGPGVLEDASPHSFREVVLCSRFMKLPEDDRRLVEALVQRLSTKKVSSGA